MAAEVIWPPAYSVRVSARALRARLRVLPGKGLEVVLPRGLDPAYAARLVERHKIWIERALLRVCPEAAADAAAVDGVLPEAILLHGGALRLPLRCAGEALQGGGPEESCIAVPARRDEAEAVLRCLRGWLRDYAARHLGRELAALAAAYGFAFTGPRFGCQKSRWGSCTATGKISLNICLVFLPRDLARHVLLHELAHTRHCNHGRGFWRVLFAAEPDALALDKRLRGAWRHVPAWVWG